MLFGSTSTPDRWTFIVFFLGDRLRFTLHRICQFMGIVIGCDSHHTHDITNLKQQNQLKLHTCHKVLIETTRDLRYTHTSHIHTYTHTHIHTYIHSPHTHTYSNCVYICVCSAKLSEISLDIKGWKVLFYQQQAIFEALNSFQTTQSGLLRARGWCPNKHKHKVQTALDHATVRCEHTHTHTHTHTHICLVCSIHKNKTKSRECVCVWSA